jgi:hypothetical protein
MRLSLILLFIVLLASIVPLKAQTIPIKQWDRTYGGNGLDYLAALIRTPDKGYILGAGSMSGISGDRTQPSRGGADFWVVRLDSMGNKLWDKAYGGSASETLISMISTSDGGYLLGGNSISAVSGEKTQPCRGNEDYWIVKIDVNGNKLWDKTFGGSDSEHLYDLKQTSDGGYILGGWSESEANGDKTQPTVGAQSIMDCWIVKIDASGNKQWDRNFGGALMDYLLTINQTPDGGYLLACVSGSYVSGDKSQPSLGGWDSWLIKIDANGIKQWDKTIGTNGDEGLACVMQTKDGGFLLRGNSQVGVNGIKSQPCQGGNDYWIVKVDANGNKIWDRTLGGDLSDVPSDIQRTKDGGFIIGGSSSSTLSGDKSENSYGGSDFWLVKTDSIGNKTWDKSYGGGYGELLRTVLPTSDGFVLGGSTYSGISGNKASLGKGNEDLWVVKLGPAILGVNEPSSQAGINIYPNPGSGLINLEIDNPQISQVLVYNSLGHSVYPGSIIKTLNQSQIQLDLIGQAKGIYTIQIITGDQSITKKVALQ